MTEKLPELLDLLSRLAEDLGGGSISSVDYWPEDLAATGITRVGDQSRLVYISLADDSSPEALPARERYFYECEVECPGEPVPYTVTARGENATYQALRGVVKEHLRL